MSNTWPVILITGSNGGIGAAILYRLCEQLCQNSPKAGLPYFSKPAGSETVPEFPTCDGATFIMACRNVKSAESQRTKILQRLDRHVERLKSRDGYDGHAEVFRKNVVIDVQFLDLASLDSVFKLSRVVAEKYPYISHLVFNAGLSTWYGIDFVMVLKQLWKGWIDAITHPRFNLSTIGETSVDGLGWLWQCNVFGHYVLFRSLEKKLLDSKSPLGSRVLWMSSLDALSEYFDMDDWQLLKNYHAYDVSKYQMDLIGTHLDQRAVKSQRNGIPAARHFVVEPGVVHTNISKGITTDAFTYYAKLVAFFLARFCHSPHHVIHPYAAAISAIHMCLLPFTLLPIFTRTPTLVTPETNEYVFTPPPEDIETIPVRFSSLTNWKGEERVGVTPVDAWKERRNDGDVLLDRCEDLYQQFLKEEWEELP